MSLVILLLNITAVSAIFSFKFNAVWVALLIGLFASLVLSTLPSPTFVALIPVAIFASVIALSATFNSVMILFLIKIESAVPPISPAIFRIPLVVVSASTNEILLMLLLLLFTLPIRERVESI